MKNSTPIFHDTWPLRCLLGLSKWSGPWWRWIMRRRLSAGKETAQSVAEKLLQGDASVQRIAAPDQPLIWGHAAGVGELLALLGLFKRLAERMPTHHFLLTSHARTSGQALARQTWPERFHHRFAPVDHPVVMQRFLDAWQPVAACWSETDLWPGMVTWTAARRIPMLLLNLRLDERKAARLKRLRWFYAPVLGRFTRIYPQNQASATALQALNWNVRVAPFCGNVKMLAPALSFDPATHQLWSNALAQRKVWLLASSHEEEEAIALAAHRQLCAAHPNALLIIVPRDAPRGQAIAALAHAQGMSALRRSAPEGSADPSRWAAQHSVYVADTMGELGLWYALSPVALIGGSLVPIGGHNPYEALAAGCAVLSGPVVHNFAESYAQLMTHGRAQVVRNAQELTQAIAHVWAQSPRDTHHAHHAHRASHPQQAPHAAEQLGAADDFTQRWLEDMVQALAPIHR